MGSPEETTKPAEPDPAKPDEPARRGRSKAKPAPYFISEGVRADLEINGKAVDPANGNPLEMDPDGKVTVTDRLTGKTTTL